MNKKILQYVFAIYAGALIAQNVLGAKQIDVLSFTVTTGILVSPFIFIAQDVITEIFGYKQARKMIMTGFAINFVAVLLFTLAIYLPPSQFWGAQEAFVSVLGTTARITLASFTAYIIGSLVNSKIMAVLKERKGKSLFVRAITSTIAGQALDNTLFSFIAFISVLPLPAILSMIIGATLFEVIYEIIFYPITRLAIEKMKEQNYGKRKTS